MAIPGSAESEATSHRDFTVLLHQHQSMVFSIAVHYLRDRAAAEEVAQEVFLQFYRHLPKLATPEHQLAWLRRVAAHRAIDCARGRRLDPKTNLADVPEPAGETPRADPMLRERLRKLVHSLPEKARMVMILRYQEDLDPEDIAQTLDMPVRTVKSHLQRSLAMLREKCGRVLGDNQV